MKTNLFLTGLSVLFISAGANAMEYQPFVGATIGFSGLDYSAATEDVARAGAIDLPSDFFSFGLETGVRFGGYYQVYNGGLTLNLDMTDSQKIYEKFTNAKIGDFRTYDASLMYDNYIRLSGDKTSRIDLVLGAGIGILNYDMGMTDYGENEYSTTFAVKAALDFELTQNITLSAQTRLFVPTRSHYGIDTNYVFGGAVKYMF
ncbi:MAG: hypothetical protein J6S57_00840 [Alphaproteobacteria bacterium]|nr:hypothetical protein [Alphaproteobacteria bacterium]